MKKYMKSYVEKKYFNGTEFTCSSDEIKERNVALVDIEEGMVGFRFFDVVFTYDEMNNVCNATKKNISSWILMGKKIALTDLAEKYSDNEEYLQIIENMRKARIKYVCEIQEDVFFAVKPQDFTYEELTGNKSRRGK